MIIIKINIRKIFIYTIFISFFITLLLSITGYYETELTRKTILTNEQIQRFEEDINNNKEIDIDKYLIQEKNYDNRYSEIGRYISNKFEKFTSGVIKKAFKFLLKAIDE